MSSNQPFGTMADHVISTLNVAINNDDPEQLQRVITREGIEHTLNVSFLDKAWGRYADPLFVSDDKKIKKINVLITLFQHSHYPEHQRLFWAQRLIVPMADNTRFVEVIVSCLNPVEEILPLVTDLIQNRFFDLCTRPVVLSQLLRCLSEDQQQAPCRQLMQNIPQESWKRFYSTGALLRNVEGVEPLLKALACRTHNIPDPDLASLTDDWQTVFTKLAAGERTLLPWNIYSYSDVLVTGNNLACLLSIRAESQRLELLRALFSKTKRCFKQLAQNEEQLKNVLMLLPESQRVELFLLRDVTRRTGMSHFVPDALWPVISPLLQPSEIAAIQKQTLLIYSDEGVTRLVNSRLFGYIRTCWASLPTDSLFILLKEPVSATFLINQLPMEAQQSVREQLLTCLLQHNNELTRLGRWLWDESRCSALFPVASRWMNDAAEVRDHPWRERLPQLALEEAALHAFLDHLPTTERHVLLSWLLSMSIVNANGLNALLDRYTDKPCHLWISSCSWADWNQKMPLVLVILERLPEGERVPFIKQLPRCQHHWKPESYQMVCRAHTLFGLSMDAFEHQVNLGEPLLTPLMQAARSNNKDKAEEHIQSLNEQDWLGRTALMHACQTNHLDMVTFLAGQEGCDFSIKTLHNESVFACAAQTGNPFLLRHLLRISPCKPTHQDALAALCFITDIECLFDSFLPKVEWQQTERSGFDPIQSRYLRVARFQRYYAQATLPSVVRNQQVSHLELAPQPLAVFNYQLRALGIDASNAMNLDYLLKALTGRVSGALHLTGFRFDAYERSCLLNFVKNNPQLTLLSLGTFDLHPEDEAILVGDLSVLPRAGSVRLAIHGRVGRFIAGMRPSVRDGFFEHSTRNREEGRDRALLIPSPEAQPW